MKHSYLFISCEPNNSYIFPCDLSELNYAMRFIDPANILEDWPRHGHGEEWRMNLQYKQPDIGTMVFDLNAQKPLTKDQLRQLGAMS